MSNFPKPDELEELLDSYLNQLEVYSSKLNPVFKRAANKLRDKYKTLKARIEKYARFSRDEQLKYLTLSDVSFREICSIHSEFEDLEEPMQELQKIFQLKQSFF